ncbi:unnamed protein product [Paramecium primaurelia]|uniref:Uncharacterized protein n=1 Tax=Paramecium primaurelia TaxID=5886 RepID=A0A8S1LZE0_PARPR|nr:unnamed protein product [Paramecium primaurelia]
MQKPLQIHLKKQIIYQKLNMQNYLYGKQIQMVIKELINMNLEDAYLILLNWNLVQIFMYDKIKNRKIILEDTLELLFVHHVRCDLDEEIQAIFGKEEQNSDGNKKSLSFIEYQEKIRIKKEGRRLK